MVPVWELCASSMMTAKFFPLSALSVTMASIAYGKVWMVTTMIGVSASAFEPDREACRQAGCADFLAKPFREEQLFAALERQLGLKWCYADAATRETASPFPSVQHAPEAADAEALFELASKGDVVGVRALAQKLAERDPRLAPFAQGVTELAARFKMKAIRQFVDRYRGKPVS